MKNIKLICLPYAGASANVFRRWNQQLSEKITLVPIELSGRGGRYGEPLYQNIEMAVEDIYKRIRQEVNTTPYALFGHSFGSLLAFELYHTIKERFEIALPEILFLSGSVAPHCIFQSNNPKYSLPDNLFYQEVLKFGLTPPEVIYDKQLADIFIPAIRNDFRLYETYESKERMEILSEVHVLAGTNDPNNSKDFQGWDRHIAKEQLSFQLFDGGHFFIFDDLTAVTGFINNKAKRIFDREGFEGFE